MRCFFNTNKSANKPMAYLMVSDNRIAYIQPQHKKHRKCQLYHPIPQVCGSVGGQHAAHNLRGRVGGGGLGGALCVTTHHGVRAGARPPVRAGSAHRRHAAWHVPPPHRLLQGGPHFLQIRHHF